MATNPELELEIEIMRKLLAELSIGSTLSYAAIDEHLGRPYNRFALMAARRRYEEASGMRLATVFNVGVKKLSAEEVAGIGPASRVRIGRTAARQAKRLVGLTYNDMPPEVQTKINIDRSLLGAISALSKGEAAQKLETDGIGKTGPEVAGKVFDLLKNGY